MNQKQGFIQARLRGNRVAIVKLGPDVLTLWPSFGGEGSMWRVEDISDEQIVASCGGETSVFELREPAQRVELRTAARTVVRVLREYEATKQKEGCVWTTLQC